MRGVSLLREFIIGGSFILCVCVCIILYIYPGGQGHH